jgi:hypothetical protein
MATNISFYIARKRVFARDSVSDITNCENEQRMGSWNEKVATAFAFVTVSFLQIFFCFLG